MKFSERLDKIFQSFCEDQEGILFQYGIQMKSVEKGGFKFFVDKKNEPFSFNNSADFLGFANPFDWEGNRSNEIGNQAGRVKVDFVFAVNQNAGCGLVSLFSKKINDNHGLITKINLDSNKTIESLWQVPLTSAINYNAGVITAEFTNIELNDFI